MKAWQRQSRKRAIATKVDTATNEMMLGYFLDRDLVHWVRVMGGKGLKRLLGAWARRGGRLSSHFAGGRHFGKTGWIGFTLDLNDYILRLFNVMYEAFWLDNCMHGI